VLSRRFNSVTNALAALITVSTTPPAVRFLLVATLALACEREGFKGFFSLLFLERGVAFFNTGVFFCCTFLVPLSLPFFDLGVADPGVGPGTCREEVNKY
jgi:hypothetical protein